MFILYWHYKTVLILQSLHFGLPGLDIYKFFYTSLINLLFLIKLYTAYNQMVSPYLTLDYTEYLLLTILLTHLQ